MEANSMPEIENNEGFPSNNESNCNFLKDLKSVSAICEEISVESEQNSNPNTEDVTVNDQFFVDLLNRNSVSVCSDQIDDIPTDKSNQNFSKSNSLTERNGSDNLLSDKEQNQILMKSSAIESDDRCAPVLIDLTREHPNQNSDGSTRECAIPTQSCSNIGKSDAHCIQYSETHSCLKSSNENSKEICEIEIIDAVSDVSHNISVNKGDSDNSTRKFTVSAQSCTSVGKSDSNYIQHTETDSCLKSFDENSEEICEIEIIEAVTGAPQSISLNKGHTMIEKFSKDEYRCESDTWTDDEDSSSSDSSSSDSETFFQSMRDNFDRFKPKKITAVKTKGELGLDDLPPIEDLTISVEENEMTLIGKVHAIVETLVVIRSFKGMKALDLDSVLFLSHDNPLGRVFDVFGPVNEPFYSVRFNSVDQINEKRVQVGGEVFFAPEKSDITLYVFVEDLQKQKGSDASWKDNNEPPVQFLDFSDDEEERRSKRERMMKIRNEHFSKDSDAPSKRALLSDISSAPYIPPPKPPTGLQNNAKQFTQRFSTPNPFLSRMPPPSPSLSVCSLMSPVRVQHSFYSPTNQPKPPALVHPQNILCRPPPSIYRSPYQQPPPIFGQIAVLSPLPSPSIPTLIPASPFTPPPVQNCFRQEFTSSPSPGFQVQRLPSDFQLLNRPFSSPNVHPSHPLTVEIPSVNDSSFPGQSLQGRNPQQQFMNHQSANVNNFQLLNPQQQFMNHQSANVNNFQLPNVNNAPFSASYPQVHSPMQPILSFPPPNFNNPFIPNVSLPPGNVQPRFFR